MTIGDMFCGLAVRAGVRFATHSIRNAAARRWSSRGAATAVDDENEAATVVKLSAALVSKFFYSANEGTRIQLGC
jgi:hypothetical protein